MAYLSSTSESKKSYFINPKYIDEWEIAVVDLFLNAAHSFGLPKSCELEFMVCFSAEMNLCLWMR